MTHIIAYAYETWVLKTAVAERLERLEIKILRSIYDAVTETEKRRRRINGELSIKNQNKPGVRSYV